jgi:hypothetical protein
MKFPSLINLIILYKTKIKPNIFCFVLKSYKNYPSNEEPVLEKTKEDNQTYSMG